MGNRAAIYSRYSTDLQSERSVEDQVALCEAFCLREGLDVVARYDDRARSGGSVIGRDGLMHLMDAARDRQFDVLIVEALDRLSRDMEDLAGLHKRLTFLGIEIRAVHEGQVNTILIGLRGIIGQMYREDNAHKVRRGMAGRIRAGLAGGGRAYGYDMVAGEKGRRLINIDEAAIVRRIFAEFLSGQSPRQIAYRLNAEGVAPPRGTKWNASTINGSGTRGNGILRNEIYAGRLVWNKIRMLKNPETGKRISRANPPAEWQIAEVPELAIIARADFDEVQSTKRALSAVSLGAQRRPKHLLSGLLRCGSCGAGMVTTGADKSGERRIRCAAWVESRSCPDPHSFYLARVEATVIDALRAELVTPRATAEFVRTYHAERKKLAERDDAERVSLLRRIEALSRDIDRFVQAIGKGIGDAAIMGQAMKEAAGERSSLQADLDAIRPAPNLVALHPAVLSKYASQLANLSGSLRQIDAEGDIEARNALRELVEQVTVRHDDTRKGGFLVEIDGRMSAILGEKAFPYYRQTRMGSALTVVAEDRYSLQSARLPSFRLYAFG